MVSSPDQKTLVELLEVAKETERKARKLNALSIALEEKWQRQLEDREAVIQKVGEIV
jgi:hypothetical protein